MMTQRELWKIPTGLSLPSLRLYRKSSSAVQRLVGGRHILFPFLTLGEVALLHNGSCLLYAMLTAQLDPTPVLEETESQVIKTMSMVPSRSEEKQTLGFS